MTGIARRKDTTNQTRSSSTWPGENSLYDMRRSKPEAAIIVGTVRRKENRTIVCRFMPKAKPPIIVGADLETPGTDTA